jgi:hypothetical protein
MDPEDQRRNYVRSTSACAVPPHYVSESSFRTAGLVSPLAVGVGGGVTIIPFWLGEGGGHAARAGHVSNGLLRYR